MNEAEYADTIATLPSKKIRARREYWPFFLKGGGQDQPFAVNVAHLRETPCHCEVMSSKSSRRNPRQPFSLSALMSALRTFLPFSARAQFLPRPLSPPT